MSAEKLPSGCRSAGEVLGQKFKDAVRTLQMSTPELSESVIKAVSALGVGSLRQSALRQVGSQLLVQRAKYQAALSVACRSGAPLVQREATIKVELQASFDLHAQTSLVAALHIAARHLRALLTISSRQT